MLQLIAFHWELKIWLRSPDSFPHSQTHSPTEKSLALETLCACCVCMCVCVCVCVCLFMWGDGDEVVLIYFITSFKEFFNCFLYLDVPYHSQISHHPVSYHSMQKWGQKAWSILSCESCHVYLGIRRVLKMILWP